MGRPPLPLGTHGAIRSYQDAPKVWRSRTLVRDYDGATREVQRKGTSKGESLRLLAEALRDRVYVGAGELTADSRVAVVAEAWYATTTALAEGTREQYRYLLDGKIHTGVGELRIRELSVAVCDRFLRAVQAQSGAAVAKMTRSVLSGICGYAARNGLLDRNPVRDTGRISAKPKRAPSALTVDQVHDLQTWLTYDDVAIRRDIPDLVAFMLGTGLRISEVAAVRWVDVDLDLGTVRVRGNVVRLKGKGLVRQDEESSKLTVRTLSLPSWCLDLLTRRRAALDPDQPGDSPVFPSPKGGLRDPSNTQADLRDAFAACGYEWVTSHVFRKTVATLMDEAGRSARDVADQLGHAQPSMSQDRYLGRRRSTGAAAVLESLRLG